MDSFKLENKAEGTALSLNESSVKGFDGLLDRLREASKVKSDVELAKTLGIKHQSVISARKRCQVPPGWIFDISSKFNISADWLYYGTGAKERGGPQPESQSNVITCADNNTDIDIDNYCFVPMVEARLSGGHGEPVYSEGIKDYYAFRRRFINYIATSPKNLILMRVTGTSMEPEIKDGGTVMIDLGRKHPKTGAYFALGYGDSLSVKELELLPAGRVRIISKNRKDYPPHEADLKDIRIIGQVIWGDRMFPI